MGFFYSHLKEAKALDVVICYFGNEHTNSVEYLLHICLRFWAVGEELHFKILFVLTLDYLMQDPEIKPLAELDNIPLYELLPEIPYWIKSPDFDRVSTQIRLN